MNRNKALILFIPFFFFLVMLSFFIGCKQEKPVIKPNIVLIVIDALRPDHLPFYGYKKATAPFMTELASKGVVFERAFATSSWTAPATSSIFTSLYPFQHGVTMGLAAQQRLIKIDNTIQITRLPKTVLTLPEMLKENGYQTYGVTANPNISKIMGLHQGFDSLRQPRVKSAKGIYKNCIGTLKKINSDKPYFLYIHFMDTHSPYRIRLPKRLRTGDSAKDRITHYDMEIKFVDEKIKNLFNAFRWDKNTIIIITADHGEEHYDHGKTGHGFSLYYEVLHVPLFFYYPYVFPAGKRIKQNVSTIDLLPTISDLLSMPNLEQKAGITLLPLIRQKKENLVKRCLFAHLDRVQLDLDHANIFSVLCRDYHYIQYAKRKMLFDLALDPHESHDIVKIKKRIAKKLAASYFTYLQNCITYSPEYTSTVLDQQQIDQLKSLGYIK